LTANSFVRPRSLADQAADRIRQGIVDSEFQLGEALSETGLASMLGVSKTPIREALLRLAGEGLVNIRPQRGTFVFSLDSAEMHQLSEFREVLEVSALGLALRRELPLGRALAAIVAQMADALADGDVAMYQQLDGTYHAHIIDHSENHHLIRSYNTIATRIQALRGRLSQNPRLNTASLKQHRKLARLIKGGQEPEAAALLRDHIRKTQDDYENTWGAGQLP
jgi:DNA-binding GntR family transcriptional regulator